MYSSKIMVIPLNHTTIKSLINPYTKKKLQYHKLKNFSWSFIQLHYYFIIFFLNFYFFIHSDILTYLVKVIFRYKIQDTKYSWKTTYRKFTHNYHLKLKKFDSKSNRSRTLQRNRHLNNVYISYYYVLYYRHSSNLIRPLISTN